MQKNVKLSALLIKVILLSLPFATACVTPERPSRAELMEWQEEQATLKQKLDAEYAPERRALAQQRIKSPFLWRIEKNGNTSYLLGTMHTYISAEELPYVVLSTFRRAGVHAYESTGRLDDASLAKLSETHAEVKQTECLDKTLKPEAWAKFRHDLLPFEQLEFRCMSPDDAYNLYVTLRTLTLIGDRVSLDGELMEESVKLGAKIEYLESSGEGLSALMSLRDHDNKTAMTAASLSQYLLEDPLKVIRSEIGKSYALAKAYKSGNLETLMTLYSDEIARLYPDLIGRRNRLWLPKLSALLQKQPVFVAVGVAHMTGDDSLLKLLEKEGFTVRRAELTAI